MTDILNHIDQGVMTLTFNRVDKKNSITSAMYDAMDQALKAAQADPAVRVVVFQGSETVFSAGNDIADFLDEDIDNGTEFHDYKVLEERFNLKCVDAVRKFYKPRRTWKKFSSKV